MAHPVACTQCGKRYQAPASLGGKHIRCKACGGQRNSGARRSDEIEYEMFGHESQYCEITLDPGEQVLAEAGAMMFMTDGIEMQSVFGDLSKQGGQL